MVAVAGPGSWRSGGLAAAGSCALCGVARFGAAAGSLFVSSSGAHVVVAVVGGTCARVVVNVVVVGSWVRHGDGWSRRLRQRCKGKHFFPRPEQTTATENDSAWTPPRHARLCVMLYAAQTSRHPDNELGDLPPPPPSPRAFDNDDDDRFCNRDTLLPLPMPARAPSTAMMAGTAMEPPTHIVTRHLSRASLDCEGHLPALNCAGPDDEETTTKGTPHWSWPCVHPDGIGCNGEDSAPAPFPVPIPRLPNNGDANDTGCDGGASRHLPQPCARSATSNDVNGTTHYPFALLAAMTTRAAVEGTPHQFRLCAFAQSSAVRIPYDDDDNNEGVRTVTLLRASLSLWRL
ncbi:hypothetical protein EDB83DRAFT_2580450 [Lactarius deliciosus]|nr:hypothetical protein EDB83DRAFT_2580450 [Lactarius deliciosus]